jgi:hypothetical protein
MVVAAIDFEMGRVTALAIALAFSCACLLAVLGIAIYFLTRRRGKDD